MAGAWAWASSAFACLVLVYLVLPTLVIVPLSFSSEAFLSFPPPGFSLRWYQAFAASIDFRLAILNSVLIGVPASLLATVAGTCAALALTRGNLKYRRGLSALMIAPIVLPQILLAIGLFPIMVKVGLNGTFPGIVLAPRRRRHAAGVHHGHGRAAQLSAQPRARGHDARRATLEHVLARHFSDDQGRRAGRLHLRVLVLVRRADPRHLPHQPDDADRAAAAVGAAQLSAYPGDRRRDGGAAHL